MKRIRIGNDINIEWSVKRYGQPENFYGRNLILKMVDPNNREHTMEFTTEGNVIRTTFLGMNQELCGSYSLVLVENSMEVGMTTIDKTVAFILVPHSYMESGVDPDGLTTTSDDVNIETEITLPADGLSAYEIAVKNGYEGTEQEWLQSLVGAPGTDGSDAEVTKENIEKALGYVPDSGVGQMMIAEDETVTGKKTFVGQICIENTDLDKNGGVILRSEPFGVVNKTDQLFVIGTKGSANIKVERDPVDDLELATRRFVIKEAGKRQAKLTAGYGITIDPSNRISVSLDLSVFKVVTILPEYPASGDENKIHLIPASKSAEQNIYTEYVYVNGVWEKLGEYNPAGGGLSELILSTTYSDLVSLRDSNRLIPGMQYRITDYQCTTTQGSTKSAGHPFDIIVRADSVSTLNEEASAIHHEGDEYFANSNLSAWKIWYCLDNDKTRFAWADETNGKGVIYRMIDEFNNDIPYDFKNIKFYGASSDYPYYYYTFASSNIENNTDCSLNIANRCYSNTIKEDIYVKRKLNNMVFIGSENYCNTFGNNCHDSLFGNNCYSNTIGNNCYNLSFGNQCYSNTIGNNCHDNTFCSQCSYNNLGNSCYYIHFESTVGLFQCNHFGDFCSNIVFKDIVFKTVPVQSYNFDKMLNHITIVGERGRKFETKVEKDSSGNLKVYCLADLIASENNDSYPYSASFIGEI